MHYSPSMSNVTSEQLQQDLAALMFSTITNEDAPIISNSAKSTPSIAHLENGDILQEFLLTDDEVKVDRSRRSSVDSNASSLAQFLINFTELGFMSPEPTALPPLDTVNLFDWMAPPNEPGSPTTPKPSKSLDLDLFSSTTTASSPVVDFFFVETSTLPSQQSPTSTQATSSSSTSSTTHSPLNTILSPILMKPKRKMLKSRSIPTMPSSPTEYSDERPRDYECNVCHGRFLRHQDLYRHKATHSTTRDFPCLYGCGSTFVRSDAAKRHMKKCRLAPPVASSSA
ncbi:hypothetical protein BDR26DRAFT_870425 [Obelidium mucronatum]|nr:hypothetical protein BDR26DRAFT_870425 [Obelidium mucronatum]